MSDFTPSTPSTPLLDSSAAAAAAAPEAESSPSSGSSSPSDGGGPGGSGGGRWCKLGDDGTGAGDDDRADAEGSKRRGGSIISRRTRYGVASSSGDLPSGGGGGVDLLARYNSLLDAHPLATKSLTAAFVQGLGAALASLWKNNGRGDRDSSSRGKKGGVDWLTVFAFAFHGGLVNGPVGHYWFEFLSKHGPKSTFKSMLLDQIVASPSLLVLMFVFLDTSKAAMREVGPSVKRTLSTVGPTIVTSWRFWPIAVLCTFRYLKKKHYTVALNLCSLAWTMYLSKSSS